jgi:hypothetical protein
VPTVPHSWAGMINFLPQIIVNSTNPHNSPAPSGRELEGGGNSLGSTPTSPSKREAFYTKLCGLL